jgi:glutamate--cysteine ligase
MGITWVPGSEYQAARFRRRGGAALLPFAPYAVGEERLSALDERLRSLPGAVLRGMRRGIEKESLRVQPDGALALTPHPAALGSALAHPHITTDFSESQLELITGVHASADSCLEELTRIHQAVYRAIGDEVLWCASMPCNLPADDAIPIGQYGASNVGRAKTVYRVGLSYRYGRRMQCISGIHYNWSLPEAAWQDLRWAGSPNEAYFALIRNFRRHSWLLFYLFGASPAVCPSFVAGREHRLETLAPGTLYLPHATSLRMGRLGYQSEAQSSIAVSHNSLESYAESLQEALTRPYPPYEAIGIRQDGEYRQLSTALLQIENEYYGKIRPKRRIHPGERPLHALRERGVEYVEVRLMDLDPFEPVGIGARTMRFLDAFLLHCLLAESPPDTPAEIAAVARNHERVASRGREPGLTLDRDGRKIALSEWGERLLAECAPIAMALDAAFGGAAYRDALAWAVAALGDSSLTPSAHVLAEMARNHGDSYTRFALAHSLIHRGHLHGLAFPREDEARFARLAGESVARQRSIEAADSMPFEAYRQKYLSPERLEPRAQRLR